MCLFSPNASITTITAGCRPAAVGSAMYTGMVPSGVVTAAWVVLMSMGAAYPTEPTESARRVQCEALRWRRHETVFARARPGRALLRDGLLRHDRPPHDGVDEEHRLRRAPLPLGEPGVGERR